MTRQATFLMRAASLALVVLLMLPAMALAGAPVSPLGDDTADYKPQQERIPASDKALGDIVDFDAALAQGAYYLRHAQADVTEDNAGNGSSDIDPDDGGWDWELTDPNFTHSASASATNIYGATAQGAYRAYLATGDAALFTVMTDAANVMAGNANIRSAADLIFLMNYNALPGVSGTTYADAARAKYDGRISTYGSATGLAVYIRDLRNGQGFGNGIIAWDIGPWAVVAQMLDGWYPGDDYDLDADDIAEVLYQDSFNDTPGYFDIIDDQGFDPTYANQNFWWYNLGITGLIDAFRASDTHTGEISGLVTILLAGQHGNGGVGYSYGVNDDDEDLQSTAYAAMCLANLDQPTYQDAINRMAYFLAATQHTSGGWVYTSGNHNPEIGGECTAGLSYGEAPHTVLVDDDFTDQTAVDLYNSANSTHYVYGYDAFGDIQSGIDAVVASTVIVLPGTYYGPVVVNMPLTLQGAQAGVDARGRVATESIITSTSGAVLDIQANNVIVDGFTLTGGDAGAKLVDATNYATGLELRNNIIDGVGSSLMYVGITAPGIIIEQNEIDAVGMSQYLFFFDGESDTHDNLAITDNNLRNGDVFAGGKTFGSSNLSMTGNLFDGASMNLSSHFQGATISGNTFQNIAYTFGQVGLLNSTISGNTFAVAGPSPSAGNPSYALMLWGSQYGLSPSQNVTVTGNTFSFNGFALPSDPNHGLRILSGIDATTIHINDNNFLDQGAQTGAYALVNQGTGAADASCNWWGSVAGPDAPGNPNPAGAAISGPAVFWPWLDGMVPGGSCILYGGNNVATADQTICECTPVTVAFDRTNTDELRAVSVTFQISGDLELCGTVAPSIVPASGPGSVWDGFTNLQSFVVDNGGGSYTVDMSLTGNDPGDCGSVVGGDLLDVYLGTPAGVVGDATGTITVTSVVARDCANAPLPGIPGAAATITIDHTGPAAATDLTATQVKTGNGSDGTTDIQLGWTLPSGAANVTIWRKGFGYYPEYDDDGGNVPTGPVTGANGWTQVGGSNLGAINTYTDAFGPNTRDFYYYAVYVEDTCGNVSPVSGITDGTLNYHLGDVAPAPAGNNLVETPDISRLGSYYGLSSSDTGYKADLDVGPTTDFSVDGRPTTDNYVGFEDLVMFAINYNDVSKEDLPDVVAATRNEVRLVSNRTDAATISVDVQLAGDGTLQALSVPLTWDAAVVEPMGFLPGDLLERQGGQSLVLQPQPGTADAAIFGLREHGIRGEGVLATITFRVKGEGDPAIDLGEIVARDQGNEAVKIIGTAGEQQNELPVLQRTTLLPNAPNPFNPSTRLAFTLKQPGRVHLAIYDLQGQLVRTLVSGDMTAGEHSLMWAGRNDAGRAVSSGTYLVRLVAPDASESRTITLVK